MQNHGDQPMVLRERMIERQLKARGIHDERLIAAFQKVEREKFVPTETQDQAYEDHPLSIGYEQTISQPYIVALMSESLGIVPTDRVLEVGTGSGYQTAILSELVQSIYSIEIVTDLYLMAKKRLGELGYQNVHLKCANGREGWPEEAPFDKIIVTAAANDFCPSWTDQLKEGGRIVAPIGEDDQELMLGTKVGGKLATRHLLSVRFVLLKG